MHRGEDRFATFALVVIMDSFAWDAAGC